MTLRERLEELAGFTDADFEHRYGAWSVPLVEDPDLGWLWKAIPADPVGHSWRLLPDVRSLFRPPET